jgi:hypothetical protein
VRDNVRDPRAPAGHHKVVLDLRAAAALHLQKPKSEICRRQLVYKFIVLAGTVGALAVPAVAQAGDTPTATDRQNAAAECRAERGDTAATREAFKARYGTNHNQANAFGKCVSAKAREEAGERSDAETGAAKTCRTEQGTTPESQAAFEQKYGTNKNKHNAFGKCVSQAANAAKADADAKDADEVADRKRAAKACAQERGSSSASEAAFEHKYGTNHNKANAFGRCVSKLAKELD